MRVISRRRTANPRPATPADWRKLFGHRTSWGMILGFFGTIYLIWLYTAWLPGYLEIQRHMSIPHTGLIAAIPFFGGTVGSLTGGLVIDRLAAGQRVTPLAACKMAAVSRADRHGAVHCRRGGSER